LDYVVLVDTDDQPIGLRPKVDAHLGEGELHRAFIALVFNPAGDILVARRSRHKMLWPLVWDGSCASHVRDGESYSVAGERRLNEELGFTCSLYEADKFTYRACYKDVGVEHEVCSSLVGRYAGDARPNTAEVAEWAWVGVGELLRGFQAIPDSYAPWFARALGRLASAGRLPLRGGVVPTIGPKDLE
jgi:isopentenyl-diphosphate delta-isomerase